ncbi:acyl-CoA dehydrogenase family protein [Saccharopolyspora sp. NPDC047091]|uniref:acyl-CoA dehydrogenase family protein n=1 Tax=Saccharopolyspora sp. NPDC047091 TaxID=3155924 RepID=UPI0033CB5F0C
MTAQQTGTVRYGSPELDELLDRIAAGAFDRERDGIAPHEQIRWIKQAGLGALRVPAEEGGGGATLRELSDVVVRLAHADSNIGHLLRAHFGTVEDIVAAPGSPGRSRWIERIVGGGLFGNGNNELGALHAGDFAKGTMFTPDGEGFRLNGTKFYSTGTLYADFSFVTGVTADGLPATALIPVDRDGVELLDDWDGFGQRLTATGTTRLTDVRVEPDEITLPPADLSTVPRWRLGPYYQHHLNLVVAGNLHSVRDDALALIRGRGRSFTHGSADLPREDPVLQEVIGEIAALAFAAEATVLETADVLDRIGTGPDVDADVHEASLRASQAQVAVDAFGLRAADLLFEVGGASATRQPKNLDRHWRNIRTVASHNPVRFKNRAIGELLVNGTTLPDNTYF